MRASGIVASLPRLGSAHRQAVVEMQLPTIDQHCYGEQQHPFPAANNTLAPGFLTK